MADYNSSYTGPQIDSAVGTGLQAGASIGLLKGDGQGGVTAATAGTDYASPADVNEALEVFASTVIPAADLVTFEAPGAFPLRDMLVNITPRQAGSGNPSSSNIRAISGWQQCNVAVAGKNLSPVQTLAKKTGDHAAINVSLKAGKKYRISFTQTGTGTYTTIYFYNDSTLVFTSPNATSTSRLITLPESANKIVFNSGSSSRGYSNIMLRLDGTESTYEPYIGSTTLITFPEDVYAGTLNPITGELRTRPYYASYNGETLVGPWVSDRDVYAEETTPTTGAQVVDLGGTETIYQVAPVEITAIKGVTNIWADCGDVSATYGAYLETVQAHADKVGDDVRSAIAPIENGTTASRAYAQGAFFFLGSAFCKAKTAIAGGAAFTLNTNYEVTSVAAELFAALNP